MAATLGSRRVFEREIHPAVVEQRRRGDARAAGARVVVGIELLEVAADFLQEGATVGIVLETGRRPAK